MESIWSLWSRVCVECCMKYVRGRENYTLFYLRDSSSQKDIFKKRLICVIICARSICAPAPSMKDIGLILLGRIWPCFIVKNVL